MLLLLHVGLVDARLVYWWFKRDINSVPTRQLAPRTDGVVYQYYINVLLRST